MQNINTRAPISSFLALPESQRMEIECQGQSLTLIPIEDFEARMIDRAYENQDNNQMQTAVNWIAQAHNLSVDELTQFAQNVIQLVGQGVSYNRNLSKKVYENLSGKLSNIEDQIGDSISVMEQMNQQDLAKTDLLALDLQQKSDELRRQ